MNNLNNFAEEDAFAPYECNGGSIVAIAGDDYAVIAGDTRLSSGSNIQSREQSKLFTMSPHSVLGSTGCWCDCLSLTGLVTMRMDMYKQTHRKIMTTDSLAQMLSIIMYTRRFFPYYVRNILAGLDKDGKGVVFSYDSVGHCEQCVYNAGGTAGPLLQPILVNQIGCQDQNSENPLPTKERAIDIASDTFISAAERDIYTGDSLLLKIITKDGIEERTVQLRKD